jgi:hypothetical protein
MAAAWRRSMLARVRAPVVWFGRMAVGENELLSRNGRADTCAGALCGLLSATIPGAAQMGCGGTTS